MKRILFQSFLFLLAIYFLAVDFTDGTGHFASYFWGTLICVPVLLILIIKDLISYRKNK